MAGRHTLRAVHACGRDGLPCFGLSACYSDLKDRALNGGRDQLTAEELAFVGLYPPRPRHGWRQPDEIFASRDAELGRGRLEFLG